MSAALTLVVLVAVGEANDPVTASMTNAARETLGADANVSVREGAIPDEAAIALAQSQHADAIAELTWRDPEHRYARVHLYVRATARWIDRELGFATSDAPAEQGRTIGFAVASMLPERAPEPAFAPRGAPPAAPAPLAAVPPAPYRWGGAVDAMAIGATGTGGGFGAALGAEWYFASHLALRAGVASRYSDVPAAAATSLFVTGGLGLAWHSWTSGDARRFALGARADALVIVEAMRHLDADDLSPVYQSRWLPGADAFLEGSWLFSEGGSVVVGAGSEMVFGSTDILFRGARVAALPPIRALAAAGIRARF